MKFTNILIFICSIFCLFGCNKPQEDRTNTIYSNWKTHCTILKHEGCDYILCENTRGGIAIVHSESCPCKKGTK